MYRNQTVEGELDPQLVLMGDRIKAEYKQQPIKAYSENPFIEALPPIMEPLDVANGVRNYPEYSDEQRKLGKMTRLHLVQQLGEYLEPLPVHFIVEQRLSRMIRHGYRARNPISSHYARQFAIGFGGILDCGLDDKGKNKAGIRPTATSFAIIGGSGQGKSTTIESSLLLYPQVIEHSNYKGIPLPVKQLIWLKLDCPFDGSTKGLCINILQGIDAVLGTTYFKKFVSKGVTQDILIPQIAQVASLHGLGVLVIDEIQNLSQQGGADKMLKFFTQLVNTIGVPIVLIGTYKAMKLFSGSFSQARRNSGQGDLIMDRLEKGKEWDFFISRLWKFQWTTTSTPLSDGLNKTLYDLSQGIIDIAVKIFMLAQWELIADIRNDQEHFGVKTLTQVAKKHLRLIMPMLRLLKSGNTDVLRKIDDLYPKWNEINEYLQESKEKLHLHGKIQSSILRDEKIQQVDDVYVELINTAIKFGVTAERAEKIAGYIIKRNGTDCGLIELRKKVIPLLDETSPMDDNINPLDVKVDKPDEKEKPQEDKPFLEPEDLRRMAVGEKVTAEDIYRNAGQAGVLGSSDELFTAESGT